MVPADLASALIAVVALTMAATPIVMLLNEKIVQPRFGTRERDERPPDVFDEQNPVIIAGFGSFGSIVGRLLRANGVGTTVLEYDSDRVDLLRKLGMKVFYGDACRTDLLRAAGAEHAKLLVVAIDSHDKRMELVDTVRKHFPHITLLVRARRRREAYDLLEAGVEHVYREKLDTGLRTGVEALRLLGRRAYQAVRAAQKFRLHDEAAVRELSEMRHDDKLYFHTARQRIGDLESLLLSDLQDTGETRDTGWDTESLREEYGDRESG